MAAFFAINKDYDIRKTINLTSYGYGWKMTSVGLAKAGVR
jgi:hypothetical protein